MTGAGTPNSAATPAMPPADSPVEVQAQAKPGGAVAGKKDPPAAAPESSAPTVFQTCPGFDWQKSPKPALIPRPGFFPMPPTGCGYYSLLDMVTGNFREDAPKYGYPRHAIMATPFFDTDWRYVDDPAKATDQQIEQAAWSTVPDVPVLFWAFRIMVGLGFYFIALFATTALIVGCSDDGNPCSEGQVVINRVCKPKPADPVDADAPQDVEIDRQHRRAGRSLRRRQGRGCPARARLGPFYPGLRRPARRRQGWR